jgi:tetratricopeptide (TPR) repeat protein
MNVVLGERNCCCDMVTQPRHHNLGTPLEAHPDPRVESLVEAARSSFRSLGANAEHWETLTHAQINPGALQSMDSKHTDMLHAVARSLFVEGDYARAVLLAVHTVTCSPVETRYSYLAGRCLQKLKQFEAAAEMFGSSLIADPDNAASALRMAQCLREMNKPDEARAAFEYAVDHARGNDSLRAVQDAALENLSSSSSSRNPG